MRKKTNRDSSTVTLSISRIKRYVLMIALAWSIMVILSSLWNIQQNKKTTRALSLKEARSHFNKDQAFRFWATAHGGVYVPAGKKAHPNPNLSHIPERDITTPSGKKLTLMNPSFMLRQVMDDYSELYGIQGRITSLKPLRALNTPDEWEKSALETFETGVDEVLAYTDINKEPYLRLMSPMITKTECLKCHGDQGYKAGDIRGGVGVSVPMKPYLIIQNQETRQHVLSHFLIWITGIICLYVAFLHFKQGEARHIQSDETLHMSEEKNRIMLNSIGDAVIATDTTGNTVHLNPVAENLTGWTLAEAQGKPLEKVFHIISTITKEKSENPVKEVLKNGVVVGLANHTTLISRDGRSYQIADSAAPIYDSEKKISGVILVFRDVTEEYAKEQQLHESKNRLKQSKQKLDLHFLQTPLAVIEWDPDFNVRSWNPAAEKIFGYSEEEIMGKHASIIVPDEYKERINSVFSELVRQKGGSRNTNRNISKMGKILHCEWFNTPVIDETGNTIAIFSQVQDITARREAEIEKDKLMLQLQQTQKMEAIGTLAGGIAHDFNNILFPIVGHTEMLMEDVPEESSIQNSLSEIYTSALRARDLVKQILTFSRQEHKTLKPMRVQPLIREALKLIRSSIPSTISIKQNINPDCGMIKADPIQIHQIVMNLTTNAYHAMEETGGELSVRLKEIDLEAHDLIDSSLSYGKYAYLTIMDTGCGMDKNLVSKIFDPFFTTKEKEKGTGMGLSVVHGIVKSLKGTVKVYSEPGKGTVFHIYLPITNSNSGQVNTDHKKMLRTGTEHILLVDDEIEIIKMETRVLERLGYQVTSCSDSREALNLFLEAPDVFDLVITDMTMPGITGDKLSAEIIQIRPDIPILMCTGFSEPITVERAKFLGIRGVMLKPVITKDLSDKIREVLDGDVGMISAKN